EIDVVSKGKPGILGIGSEPASVKVTKVEFESDNDSAKIAGEVLAKLINLMDVEAMSSLTSTGDGDQSGPTFDVEGDDAGLLIGRRGETLQAFQFITRVITNNKTGNRSIISVDVEGYNERRDQSLINLADRVAQRVVRTGREIELEPMTPRERRVIHLSLAENGNVYTESSGIGDGRRIVILPS
ncbi:protein jag, partial [Dehalococcoidia bacterium]|nr:protein jag [Dehalococcoidia bacterium]